jgi:DNA repair protein SbcD/Mre11
LAKDERAEGFLISGDIYDRAVPPPDAVELLDGFLSRLVVDLRIPVILIAGNHDSRERLGFGAKILERGRLFMFGPAVASVPFVDLKDAHGPVRFYALPYAEAAEWRQVLQDEGIRDHQAGFARQIDDLRAAHPKGFRSVLLAHCFAAGGQESESERPLIVGGGGQVDPGLFDFFDYAALGHLHRPQRAGKAWYSGSLLKYSKSEAGQEKSVCIVDMDSAGACRVERRRISPKRDLRVVEGPFDEVLRGEPNDDYVHVVLQDKNPVLDAAVRLRAIYPNLLAVERPEEKVAEGCGDAPALSRLSDEELFRAFFERVSGEMPNEAHVQVFREAVEAARRGEENAA